MLTQLEALKNFPDLSEGLIVRSMDGQKLGMILEMNELGFVIEKGVFFPKDFPANYDEIVQIENGEVILSRAQSDYAPWQEESFGGWYNQTTRNLGVPPDQKAG